MTQVLESSHPALRAAALFAGAEYTWVDDLERGRNQFVSFERRFDAATSTEGILHVFADTRYRLFINNEFVAYGPGRFVTAFPEYDSHKLGPWLRRGSNTLRVEVNYYGCASFQSMPDGCPGFIADGGLADGSVTFCTPGAWRARVHQAWDADAPHFSFAQNPAEICDTRMLARELATPARRYPALLSGAQKPWPRPSPRSAPYPDYARVQPKHILVAAPVAAVRRWGFQSKRPDVVLAATNSPVKSASFVSWLYSPREQDLALECFWTLGQLNGHPLSVSQSRRLGNHGEARVRLHAGWNFLSGNFQLLLEHWPFMLGLPGDTDVSLHALPDRACTEAFAISPLAGTREILPCPAKPEEFALPSDWSTVASDLVRITPARLVAWDAPAEPAAQRDLPYAELARVSAITARSALWSFDFGDEYYGHPVIEVEAPAGTVLDVAYDDWKRADGCVNLYHSNPFTDAADRFILHGGRQRIEVLNPRGGIYLQLVLRLPAEASLAPLVVHGVAVRRRTTLNACAGSFACGDPVLDWAWRTATHTLQTSTDEAYADCPWRERGSYIGDSLVNFHLHRFVSTDLSVARRTLQGFAHAQLPDGQLACCAPSWLTKPHEDFTLLWIQAVRDYWAHTGDVDFARRQFPVIRRIFESPSWTADSDDLWDATNKRLFIDWGVLRSERSGPGNAALNLFRIGALRAAAELARAVSHDTQAESWIKQAALVAAALERRLWDQREGRFNPSIGASTTALHANILALRHGVGPADRILAYVEPLLRENFTRGIGGGSSSGTAELYFFHYLLPALVAHDRIELAESLIQETYGYLQKLGYPTLTECFHRAHEGRGSCCHSWSGAPAIYATEHVLGLRLARPGHPDEWRLDPVGTRHAQAEGAVPHPRGLIHASWTRLPGGIVSARVSAPEGVVVTPAPHVILAGREDNRSPKHRAR